MASLDEILKETGDEAKDLVIVSFKKILADAKDNSLVEIKETAEKLETWLKMKANGEIDDEELDSLIRARKRVAKQFVLSQEISSRAHLEKLSVGLIDMATSKILGAII